MKKMILGLALLVTVPAFAGFSCKSVDGKYTLQTFQTRGGEVVTLNQMHFEGMVKVEPQIGGQVHTYELQDKYGMPATLVVSVKNLSLGGGGLGSCRARVCPPRPTNPIPLYFKKAKFTYKGKSLDFSC